MATLRCGLSCAHCLAVSDESGFADMPLENVRALIDEVAQMGVAEFLVTGGEPLARPDLADVIAYLGHRQISWTLNTAALPGKSLRDATTRHKPGFVAVSLDGPREIHDAFRGRPGAWDEAIEALHFFKSLGVRVCAGTTVTTRNYDHLEQTFHLAAAHADQWGIHLLVPEGRAATRPDLFLSKAQLKRLIKFVARKRRYFRVEMADEIGYLGYLEPLVRDRPLVCGAGRSQCVILPDGHVVPCTTLDRSCSAGNIHERPLHEIWATGFADLRTWRPAGKCARCDYAVACRGGCWLQRKAGKQCFKDLWHVPGALKTAAGIAICLGTLAATESTAQSAMPLEEASSSITPAAQLAEHVSAVAPMYLDDAIMRFYAEMAAGLEIDSMYSVWDPADCNDVACQFFTDFKNDALPEDITERCAVIRNALDTEHRSLSLIALLWRALCEPLFATDNVTEYTEPEHQEIRDTLAALKGKADAWRLEIFEGYLDPYLSNGRNSLLSGPRTKSGPHPGEEERLVLLSDLNKERWGVTDDPESWLTLERTQLEREAAETYLLDHRYADQMDLVFTFSGTSELIQYTGDEAIVVSSHIDGAGTGQHTIGIFDTVAAVQDVSLSFEIKGHLRLEPAGSSDTEALLDDDRVADNDLSQTVRVTLWAGREYTYLELLQRIYTAHATTLLSIARDWLPGEDSLIWNENTRLVIAVHQNSALLWPAFRKMIETGGTFLLFTSPRNSVEVHLSEEELGHAVLKEIDFWMF
jgi:radical SAM protein with 4Fe4S-binding SPASM domain